MVILNYYQIVAFMHRIISVFKGQINMTTSAKNSIKIMVATDFSKNSDLAILKAINIAKATNAHLTVVHVIQKKTMDNFLDSTLKKLLPKNIWLSTEEHRAILLQEKIDSLSRYELKIETLVLKKGKPAVKILQYAKKNKFDLLVIGAHGKYSLRDTFVGTTAEYLADKSICPIFIVKNMSQNVFKNILVPIDFSKVSKKALHYAIKLFPHSHVNLLHVGDYDFENLLIKEEKKSEIPQAKIAKMRDAISFYLNNKMKKFIKGYGKKLGNFSFKIILGYPGPSIIKVANELKNDAIVMGTQGHGRHHYLFMGSVAKRVLREYDKDILLVPPKSRKR